MKKGANAQDYHRWLLFQQCFHSVLPAVKVSFSLQTKSVAWVFLFASFYYELSFPNFILATKAGGCRHANYLVIFWAPNPPVWASWLFFFECHLINTYTQPAAWIPECTLQFSQHLQNLLYHTCTPPKLRETSISQGVLHPQNARVHPFVAPLPSF